MSVPAKIFNLVDESGVKKSNLEMIVDYLIAEPGVVVLTEHQQAYLARLEVVDELFRTGQYNVKEMTFIHAKKCNQSVVQSKRDIQDAEFAFGASRKSNKTHKIHRHYDRLEAIFIALHKSGQTELAIKMADVMNKALALMPADQAANRSPTQIIMNITESNAQLITDNPLTDDEALAIALKKFEITGVVLEDPENDDRD